MMMFLILILVLLTLSFTRIADTEKSVGIFGVSVSWLLVAGLIAHTLHPEWFH